MVACYRRPRAADARERFSGGLLLRTRREQVPRPARRPGRWSLPLPALARAWALVRRVPPPGVERAEARRTLPGRAALPRPPRLRSVHTRAELPRSRDACAPVR